jgi:hypothetical protein
LSENQQAANYRTVLPDAEVLQQELEKAREALKSKLIAPTNTEKLN